MFERVDDQQHADAMAEHVSGMTAALVDSVTGLDARGDDGWEAVVTAVQREVVDALREGRFTGTPYADDVAHELADGLVPVYTAERVREFAIVGAAWQSDAPAEMGVSGDMIEMVGVALYDVYRSAVGALLDSAADAVPEPDGDALPCTSCGTEAEVCDDSITDGAGHCCAPCTVHVTHESV